MTEDNGPPTVADLIATLSTLDPSLPVVVAADEEGNGFEMWSGDVEVSLFSTEDKETFLTPEAFAEDQAKEKPKYGPDDEPPEVDGDDIVRVAVVWP